MHGLCFERFWILQDLQSERVRRCSKIILIKMHNALGQQKWGGFLLGRFMGPSWWRSLQPSISSWWGTWNITSLRHSFLPIWRQGLHLWEVPNLFKAWCFGQATFGKKTRQHAQGKCCWIGALLWPGRYSLWLYDVLAASCPSCPSCQPLK